MVLHPWNSCHRTTWRAKDAAPSPPEIRAGPHCRPSYNPVCQPCLRRACKAGASRISPFIATDRTMPLRHSLRISMFGALAALTLATAPALAADPVFPTNSRVGMVPPAGFTPAARFVGFENVAANAAILISSMPAEAYPEIEKNLTDEALNKSGLKVTVREPISFKDGKGVFIAGSREASGQKRYEGIAIATTGGVTTFISVQMLDSSRAKVTDAMLRDAFKTISVRKEIPDSERLSILPYKFNTLAGFRVLRTAGDGSAILTDGPKDSIKNVEQPFLLVGVKVGSVPKREERDKFARDVFSGAPDIKDVKITRAEQLRIGAWDGYEIMADAKEAQGGADITVVQWLRFGETG